MCHHISTDSTWHWQLSDRQLREMGGACNTLWERNEHTDSVETADLRKQLWRPRRKLEDNIKMDVKMVDGRVWTAFVCSRTRGRGTCCEHCTEHAGFIKWEEVLANKGCVSLSKAVITRSVGWSVSYSFMCDRLPTCDFSRNPELIFAEFRDKFCRPIPVYIKIKNWQQWRTCMRFRARLERKPCITRYMLNAAQPVLNTKLYRTMEHALHAQWKFFSCKSSGLPDNKTKLSVVLVHKRRSVP
jgi:hypothetical protein